VKSIAIKEARQLIIFTSLFCAAVGSGMEKLRIWDKQTESTTLKKGDELWAFDGSTVPV
jgi:hypothetical protein